MTHKEIEEYRKRLIEIKISSGDRNKAFIELEAKVGAAGCSIDMPTRVERDAEHIRSIHQALQTATTIDMCRTASRNFWIAIVAAITAGLSALAAWCAVLGR